MTDTSRDVPAPGKAATYDQLLLQTYHDCHASIDQLHARIDTLSRNYLLAIGAVISVYIGATGNLPEMLLLIIPVLAFVAWLHVLGMRRVFVRLCACQSNIERYFETGGDRPQPARDALVQATDGQLKTPPQKPARDYPWFRFWWYDTRVKAWGVLTIATVLAAAAIWLSGTDLNTRLFPADPPLSKVLAPFGLPEDASADPASFTIPDNEGATVTCTIGDGWRITCNQ